MPSVLLLCASLCHWVIVLGHTCWGSLSSLRGGHFLHGLANWWKLGDEAVADWPGILIRNSPRPACQCHGCSKCVSRGLTCIHTDRASLALLPVSTQPPLFKPAYLTSLGLAVCWLLFAWTHSLPKEIMFGTQVQPLGQKKNIKLPQIE